MIGATQAALFGASDFCQRWTDRGPSWRHASEGGFDRRRYDVAPVPEADARAFVERHHYSASYPAARLRFGILERGELVGVAVLSVPAREKVLTNVFPTLAPYAESLELGRFVLTQHVPANAESWFLARAFELAAAAEVRGVVSFSDPLPRETSDGRRTFVGHVGTIYQASNATYTGRGTPRTLSLLPDATVLSDRTVQKIRAQERGAAAAERSLVAAGAPVRDAGEDPTGWLARALPAVRVRKVRHPGNHRYAFAIGDRRARRLVALGVARIPTYPKAAA